MTSTDRRIRRLLRWYPRVWRENREAKFAALFGGLHIRKALLAASRAQYRHRGIAAPDLRSQSQSIHTARNPDVAPHVVVRRVFGAVRGLLHRLRHPGIWRHSPTFTERLSGALDDQGSLAVATRSLQTDFTGNQGAF
jgi:hypothetical protein